MNQSKPNIIMIVLDTHRVDRLGIYGYSRGTSPNLDDFAKKSTVFEKAISPAQWTIPSHASMFTGEYPTTHNVLQSGDALNDCFKTVAEHLLQIGYKTKGFCNNPLVGVLDNGFRRGFQKFYNYGGTVPLTPSTMGGNGDGLISRIRKQYFRLIDRLATPIQQAVAASPDVLRIALNPWLVPLWTRYSNFKGDTNESIKDTSQYIRYSVDGSSRDPHFTFLNLMETHLPYTPPKRFIQEFAPIVLEEPKAQEFIRVYNTQALKWFLPLENPYSDLEAQTLNEMYDAEVAYQDHLLQQLLSILDQPKHRDNSLVIIVGDHGEMLGEHQIMGHGLGVYEDLVHVPLIIRYPGQVQGKRVKNSVSAVNIFHTILEEAGIDHIDIFSGERISPKDYNFSKQVTRMGYIYSEAYTPLNLILILEKYAPPLIDQFNCHATRWAIYEEPYKLIRVEEQQDRIFNYILDPEEQQDLYPILSGKNNLAERLELFLEDAQSKGSKTNRGNAGNIGDEAVMQRLRKLGYIE